MYLQFIDFLLLFILSYYFSGILQDFFAGMYRDLSRELLLRTVVVLNELHIEDDEVFHLPAKEVFDF